jgi:hypothetical protein
MEACGDLAFGSGVLDVSKQGGPHGTGRKDSCGVWCIVEDGEGIKRRVALGKKGIGGSEGSEDDSGLGFFFDGCGEDVEGCGDGIEPAATRGCQGRKIGALEHQAEQPMWAMRKQTQRSDGAELGQPSLQRLLCEQVRVKIAPRLTGGEITAEQRERFKSRDTSKRAVVGEQEFTTPKLSIGAITKAIECDPQKRWGVEWALVFGHTSGDVGVMVLDAMYREVVFFGECVSVLCGGVLRVGIDGDQGGGMIEKRGELV